MSGPASDLLAAAVAARANAYAPYSNFAVGAAVRAASGKVYAAANVENASFPVGTCAEAGAIAAMIAAGERRIVEALVVGSGPHPLTPCGACRQRLAEFAGATIPVHAVNPDGIGASFTLGALLPETFRLDCPAETDATQERAKPQAKQQLPAPLVK